jgi:hypothetical protein
LPKPYKVTLPGARAGLGSLTNGIETKNYVGESVSSFKFYYASRRPFEADNLSRASADDSGDVIAPQCQSGALLTAVVMPIVNSGNAASVTAEVIECRLDNVWRCAKLDHAGCDRPAQIMQRPLILHAGIELAFVFPAGEANRRRFAE